MTATYHLDISASDLKRKDFDSFIQGWCLSVSSHGAGFRAPRYFTTRTRLKERVKELSEPTMTLLVQTIIATANTLETKLFMDAADQSLVDFMQFIPSPMPQKLLDMFWENKCYSALREFYCRSTARENTSEFTAREAFIKRMFPIWCTTGTEERGRFNGIANQLSAYILNIKDAEGFAFLNSLNDIWVTKRMLRNTHCPAAIIQASKDTAALIPSLLENDALPKDVLYYIITKYNLPLTSYHVTNSIRDTKLAPDIVVTVRRATDADKAAGLTLQQTSEAWTKLKTEEGI